MKRALLWLEQFSGISALPAQAMTYAVVLIWLLGAAGITSAAMWWKTNAESVTAFVQLSIGIWFAYKMGGKVIVKTKAPVEKEGT